MISKTFIICLTVVFVALNYFDYKRDEFENKSELSIVETAEIVVDCPCDDLDLPYPPPPKDL